MLTAPDDSNRSKTRSCGCLQKEYFKKPARNFNYKEEYINQIYNGIKVLYKIDKKDNDKNNYYKCKCLRCNNEIIAIGKYLKQGRDFCPFCSGSINEKNITYLLTKNNIIFEKQKTFDECKDINKLPFDFFIENKYIIEYDGAQHFMQISNWDFKKQYLHDSIKNNYCFKNNIPLIRIPYDAEYTIDDLKLETTRFLLTSENEEEYYKRRTV